MKDVFLEKLRQVNISTDADKTKERMGLLWEGADSAKRKSLVSAAGTTIYNAISKTQKTGRITAKMTILISRHLDVTPFYLIGSADEADSYSEIALKKFLLGLGYGDLWREYSKHGIADDANVEAAPEPFPARPIAQEAPVVEQAAPVVEAPVAEAAPPKVEQEAQKPKETLDLIGAVFSGAAQASSSAKIITNEEILALVRAVLICAKVKNSDLAQISAQIKALFDELGGLSATMLY
ncbi:MAG: hypothetical protein FWH48_01715 [Oscillospiraceae bacterium]|nr:hypothetical protein [Oscillospiraceae bacterium]